MYWGDKMQNGLPNRKITRLKDFEYNEDGAYFITICTKNRCCILSQIVGTSVADGPQIKLTEYGEIANKYIKQLNDFYDYLSVESYVIMPNHIHILLLLNKNEHGPSRTPVPTVQNSIVSKFISTFKRFCNKEIGENIWQYRSFDHVVRNSEDYNEIQKYIYNNPLRWQYDKLYTE